MFIIFTGNYMKKVKNKVFYLLFLLINQVFTPFDLAAQSMSLSESGNIIENTLPETTRNTPFIFLKEFNKLIINKNFDEVRIWVNDHAHLLQKNQKDSVAQALITHHPAFNKFWQMDEVWGNESHEVLPTDTTLELVVCNEKACYSWYGSFTSPFSWRWGRMHKGMDTHLQIGDTVRASFNGIVRYSMFNDHGYGNAVVIRHFSGIETLYGHFDSLIAHPGQLVMAGEPIGLGGTTGRSTGPHLHYETRLHSSPFDPEKIFDKTQNMALRDTLVSLKKSEFYYAENAHFKHAAKTSSSKDSDEIDEHKSKSKGKKKGKDKAKDKAKKGSKIHTVKSGETLSSIARKHNTTVAKLMKLNKLKNANQLKIGQKLKVK
jgi:murein DD-endopeptidase MepM/ murein hydrolase activator NlpD